jgi:hypothetical protein
MLNSGRVALLDHPKMVAQLCSLERRTTRGTGRDIVDHAPNGHDDLINAAAGSLCLANLGPVPLNFHVPTVGPGRSEWIASAGFGQPDGGLPVSMADGAYADATMPPGGWEFGSPAADPYAYLNWNPKQ